MCGSHEKVAFCLHTYMLLWGFAVCALMNHTQHRGVPAREMSNRRHGGDGQLIWITILCILNSQNSPVKSEHYTCYLELEVCINGTKVLRFWLEPAELDGKIIKCTGSSLKGQIPLQLAELYGKQSPSISAEETWDDSPETETNATGPSFAIRMFTPRLSYLGY